MTFVGRVLAAIEETMGDEKVMEDQLRRMVERTSHGVDVRGAPFAPYKRLPKDGRRTPLGRGGLLARAKVDSANSLDGVDLRATVTGMTARIAYYQNRHRQFWGFAEQDRNDVMSHLKSAIGRVR